jgi:hypothetical protein
MYQWRLFRLLFLPSLLSGLVASGAAVAFVAYSAWQYIQENLFFYEYLFGSHGFRMFFWERQTSWQSFWQGLLSDSFIYGMFVAAAAVITGVVIYAILQGISILFRQTSELALTVEASGATRSALLAEVVTRLCLRIIGIMGWTLYTALFVAVIMSYVVTQIQQGVTSVQAGMLQGIWLMLWACVVLAVGLHVHIIFVRFCALRPRVFGGDKVIEEVEI